MKMILFAMAVILPLQDPEIVPKCFESTNFNCPDYPRCHDTTCETLPENPNWTCDDIDAWGYITAIHRCPDNSMDAIPTGNTASQCSSVTEDGTYEDRATAEIQCAEVAPCQSSCTETTLFTSVELPNLPPGGTSCTAKLAIAFCNDSGGHGATSFIKESYYQCVNSEDGCFNETGGGGGGEPDPDPENP